jgi:hypothetical protein
MRFSARAVVFEGVGDIAHASTKFFLVVPSKLGNCYFSEA